MLGKKRVSEVSLEMYSLLLVDQIEASVSAGFETLMSGLVVFVEFLETVVLVNANPVELAIRVVTSAPVEIADLLIEIEVCERIFVSDLHFLLIKAPDMVLINAY